MKHLFTPYHIRNWNFPNRIVMPPMVRYTLNDRTGCVTEQSIAHYRACAEQTGLVVVEATAITENAKLHPHMLGLWRDEQIEGMSQLVSAIHKAGAVAMVQLCYAGLFSRDPAALALGPSPEYFDTTRLARGATVEEIHAIEELHRTAAIRAQKAGFDGIELHATHGYFNNRFLDPICNRRTDRYTGATVEGRTRIVRETLEAIRGAVGDSMLLCVRLGCNTPNFETARENLLEITQSPIDLLHFSRGIVMPTPDPALPDGWPCNTVVYHSSRLARETALPSILSNEIRTPAQADYLIANGLCELVAVGRGMLADPHWSTKAAKGSGDTIVSCFGCADCQWRIDPKRCPAKPLQSL